MQTAYDWITVAIFAWLVVLFLQRSTADEVENGKDRLLFYLAAGCGCAVANYLGNKEEHALAILLLGGTLVFIWHFLKPFRSWPKR